MSFAMLCPLTDRFHQPRLSVETTLALIRATARLRHFLAYADVAFANGAEWTLVRRRMRDHLMAVCRAAMADGGPLVSSIVVNRRLIRTGDMEAETLAGFLAAAHKLGFGWTDGRAFLRAQQEATFRWANELRSLCAAPDEGGRE
jgi:hypothetical protein